MPQQPLSDFIDEALRVVKEAEDRRVILRVMGACAIKIHCTKFRHFYNLIDRQLTDIDFMSYSKYDQDIESLFVDLGYKSQERFRVLRAGRRHIYRDIFNKRVVDIFFDRLAMCHTIDFNGRLELDYPTITLADILLEKMQIVNISEKDIKDTIILLVEHDIGEDDIDKVNSKYISSLLSTNWGFYYTATNNLKLVEQYLSKYKLSNEHEYIVKGKLKGLVEQLEKEPKTFQWNMRALIGTKKQWYSEVEN